MQEKVIIVLVDGMRPDAIEAAGHPFSKELISKSAYTLNAKTVFPSVTLPCHMSLFHSVDPSRHGITTNVYSPMARPLTGLIEQLDLFGKRCAFFITWEPLRDLARPTHLVHSEYRNINKTKCADRSIADSAISYIKNESPDFSFVYLGETDEFGGHGHGWMSPEYLENIRTAWDCIEQLYREFSDEYTLIVLADHGGHERTHGTEMTEDMTIPIIINGRNFPHGYSLEGASIKDIAPTVTTLLATPTVKEWEGKSLI